MFIPWWAIILGLLVVGMILSHSEKRVDNLENRVMELEDKINNNLDNSCDGESVE